MQLRLRRHMHVHVYVYVHHDTTAPPDHQKSVVGESASTTLHVHYYFRVELHAAGPRAHATMICCKCLHILSIDMLLFCARAGRCGNTLHGCAHGLDFEYSPS